MIEMEQIKKSYQLNGKDVLILKGISVFIAKGEFVSIMGPSGSGKSTLSAILGCLAKPSAGSYKINGVEVSTFNQDQLARLRNREIGFIFQDFNLLTSLSALENVALPLVYAGVSAAERKKRAMNCLRMVGLGEKAYNRPAQLSGGQKQRVAIARALVNEPKFLFADEPTGALDKKTGQEVLGIIQRLNMLGHTVVQVTHSPIDANYSKRILHLVDGNVVRDELVEHPTIGAIPSMDVALKDDWATKLWKVAQHTPTHTVQDAETLRNLLKTSQSREALLAAAKAVMQWDSHDVDDLIEMLFSSNDWMIRSEIIKASKKRPKEAMVQYYLRGIRDENAWVRHIAMSEIKTIRSHLMTDQQRIEVMGHLKDSDERVRASCVYLLSRWNIVRTEDILRAVLRDPDGRVRANAVEAVKAKGLEKQLMKELEQCLSDRFNRVRANAALVLAPLKPDVALETALSLLNAPDPMSRSSGAWLLGKLHVEKSGYILLDFLKSEKEDIVINQIVKTLGKLAERELPLKDQVEKIFSLGQIAS